MDIVKQTADEKPKQFRVSVIRQHGLVMPELWLDVYVEGDNYEQAAFSDWLVQAKCSKALTPEDADVVIFTGGTDVDPALYGADRMSSTDVPDRKRDTREMLLYQRCVTQGIPMMGICRGAQFLAVMNGAKLYQHVDNHNGGHDIFDVRRKQIITNASSVHHQMVIADEKGGMEVIADATKARNRFISEGVNRPGHHMDVEAFFYRDTVCLGIQGHPEYRGYARFSQWCLEQMNDFFLDNPDIALRETKTSGVRKFRRVKEALLLERKHILKPRNTVSPSTDGIPTVIADPSIGKNGQFRIFTSQGSEIFGTGVVDYTGALDYIKAYPMAKLTWKFIEFREYKTIGDAIREEKVAAAAKEETSVA